MSKLPAWGATCPDCGDMSTRVGSSGFDVEGHRIRYRRCDNCETHFTTVEVAVPFSFSRLNATKRGRRAAATRYPPRHEPDRIVIETGRMTRRQYLFDRRRKIAGFIPTDAPLRVGGAVVISVEPGRRIDLCRKGQHRMRGVDVYVNPNNGQRTCNPCRRATALALYHYTRQKMPPSIKADKRECERERSRRRRAA